MEACRVRSTALSRGLASGLLLAFCTVVVLMMLDTAAFVGGGARPPRAAARLSGATSEGDLPATFAAGGRTHPGPPAAVNSSWLYLLPAAICASACLATSRSPAPLSASCRMPAPRRARHVRYFFGGGEAAEQEDGELSEEAQVVIAKLEEEIEELQGLVGEKQSAHDRLELEIQNFRKRTRAELSLARGKAVIPLINDLLPIADEYELAKQNIKIETEGQQAIKDRFDALFDRMLETWKGLGVTKLESTGQPFNPELHEAVSMIPSAEYASEVVCNELRAGWVLKSAASDEPQVLRAALVCVSSGPGPS